MLLITYTALYLAATVGTVLVLSDLVPRAEIGVLTTVVWIALVPSSFAIETVSQGSVQTISQPTLAFVAVAGLGVSAVFTFVGVVERLRPRTDLSRAVREVVR